MEQDRLLRDAKALRERLSLGSATTSPLTMKRSAGQAQSWSPSPFANSLRSSTTTVSSAPTTPQRTLASSMYASITSPSTRPSASSSTSVDVEHLRATVHALRDENSKLLAQSQMLTANLRAAEDARRLAHDKCAATAADDSRLVELRRELQRRDDELAAATQTQQGQAIRMRNLQQGLVAAAAREEEFDARQGMLNREVEEARQRIVQLERERQAGQADLHTAHREVLQLTGSTREALDHADASVREKAQVELEMVGLREQVDAAAREVEQSRADAERRVEAAEEVARQLHAQLEELEREKEHSEVRIRRAEKRAETAEAKSRQDQEQRAAATAKLDVWERRVREAESGRAAAVTAVQQARSEATRAREEVAERDAEVVSLTRERDELRLSSVHTRDALVDARRDTDTAQAEIGLLTQQADGMRRERDSAVARLREMMQQQSVVVQEGREATSERVRLERRAEALESARVSAEDRAGRAEGRRREAEERVEALETRLAEVSGERSALAMAHEKLERELGGLRERTGEQEERMRLGAEETAQLRRDGERQRKQCALMERELEELGQKLKCAEEGNSGNEATMREFEGALESQEKRVEELVQEVGRMRSERERLQRALSAMGSRAEMAEERAREHSECAGKVAQLTMMCEAQSEALCAVEPDVLALAHRQSVDGSASPLRASVLRESLRRASDAASVRGAREAKLTERVRELEAELRESQQTCRELKDREHTLVDALRRVQESLGATRTDTERLREHGERMEMEHRHEMGMVVEGHERAARAASEALRGCQTELGRISAERDALRTALARVRETSRSSNTRGASTVSAMSSPVDMLRESRVASQTARQQALLVDQELNQYHI